MDKSDPKPRNACPSSTITRILHTSTKQTVKHFHACAGAQQQVLTAAPVPSIAAIDTQSIALVASTTRYTPAPPSHSLQPISTPTHPSPTPHPTPIHLHTSKLTLTPRRTSHVLTFTDAIIYIPPITHHIKPSWVSLQPTNDIFIKTGHSIFA